MEPGTPVRVWQPEYAPEPVMGQLLDFGACGPRLLMEQMVVMDRSRALHVECESGLRLQIAAQHCAMRSDPQGRGWLLVCDCVPRVPKPLVLHGPETPWPTSPRSASLRWEGSTQPPESVPLLELSRQGLCFTAETTPEIGRRFAFHLPDEEQQPPLIAQVHWLLHTGCGKQYVGAEFVSGQRVEHLPESESPASKPAAEEKPRTSAWWWPVLGVLLMAAALWYLLSQQ